MNTVYIVQYLYYYVNITLCGDIEKDSAIAESLKIVGSFMCSHRAVVAEQQN